MALNLKEKKDIISKIKEISKQAISAVIVDISGINSNKINELRKNGRKNGVQMFVIRNTLLNLAVHNTQFECLKKSFIGSTLIAYSLEYAGAAARLFKNFLEIDKNLKIKAAAFEGSFIPANQIDYLYNQPTYKEAITSMLTVIQEASIGKLIRILHYITLNK